MDPSELLDLIAAKDFDLDGFVDLATQDESARNEIVHQMLTNPAIMVYYHCYYVIEKASRGNPLLFYPHWDHIASLLQHENSYHRDFAIEILGNLAAVDTQDKFSQIRSAYFSRVNDPKFMTGNCCIRNLRKIYQYKPEHRKEIFQILLNLSQHCDYTEKQMSLLKADAITIFDEVYDLVDERSKINEFIINETNSISPKTRKLAKIMTSKYSLTKLS